MLFGALRINQGPGAIIPPSPTILRPGLRPTCPGRQAWGVICRTNAQKNENAIQFSNIIPAFIFVPNKRVANTHAPKAFVLQCILAVLFATKICGASFAFGINAPQSVAEMKEKYVMPQATPNGAVPLVLRTGGSHIWSQNSSPGRYKRGANIGYTRGCAPGLCAKYQ